jgi:hypothetical protein
MPTPWLLSFVLLVGCVGPNVSGTWQTINGRDRCQDYKGLSFSRMRLTITPQGDDESREEHELVCKDSWFDIYVPPGAYWMSMAAMTTTTLDDELGWTVDTALGASPVIGVVVGDEAVVVAPFLVDVGR